MEKLAQSVRKTDHLIGRTGDKMGAWDLPRKYLAMRPELSHKNLSERIGKEITLSEGRFRVVGLETLVTPTAMSPIVKLIQHLDAL